VLFRCPFLIDPKGERKAFASMIKSDTNAENVAHPFASMIKSDTNAENVLKPTSASMVVSDTVVHNVDSSVPYAI
jgi:hypothetical protein